MKTRMSLVDIRAIVAELNAKITGFGSYRMANFYDLANKAFLMKFSKSESEKVYILIESGMRLHTTKFEREKNDHPSNFTAKVRKYIRTRRCDSVKQLGIDRIVDFTFGLGENGYHLIAEFYAKGNMILTDHNYKILAVLRPHTLEENIKYGVGEKYPMDSRKTLSTLTEEKLISVIQHGQEKDGNLLLKNVLNVELDYGPGFALHCMITAGISPSQVVGKLDTSDKELISKLCQSFQSIDTFLQESETKPQKGYIVMKEGCNETFKKLETMEEKRKFYDEFHPYNYIQFKDRVVLEFDTFDHATDEFFGVSDTSSLNQSKSSVENTATKKVEKRKGTQDDRVKKLQHESDSSLKKAQLIEWNSEITDKAIEIIASAKKQGINWDEIKNVVKDQTDEGNPIALMIHSLNLGKDEITLLLSDPQGTGKPEKVEVNVTMSALANVKEFYGTKKKSIQKLERTLEHTDLVLQLAEEKSKKKLTQKTQKITQIKNIQQMRKRLWFEKFNWFVTSENYLVLAGRDAQQNDILIKRYMRKGDIYVHADIHGASSCIIKNPTGNAIPKQTLTEAGIMTCCRSSAWNAKITANAWWVFDSQVSKTAQSGEYLPTGSFMIRGKKNFLPPSQMMMCISIMFKLSDESVGNHIGERKVETTDEDAFIQLDSIDDHIVEKKVEVFHKSGEVQHVTLKDEAKKEDIPQFTDKKDEKRKLTPKERKVIKNIVKTGVSEKEATEKILKGDEKTDREDDYDDSKSTTTDATNKSENGSQKLKRGQKSKLKKIKEKYGEQDEEERKLKMLLLGHKPEVVKEVKKVKTVQEIEEIKKVVKEQEEIKKLLVEENISFSNAETNVIDSLTGNPKEGDVILFAVPVCGPYAALRNYKYKIKVLPGSATRGKAAKTSHTQFLSDSNTSVNEHNFIKGIHENIYVEALLGNCKVMVDKEEKKPDFKKGGKKSSDKKESSERQEKKPKVVAQK